MSGVDRPNVPDTQFSGRLRVIAVDSAATVVALHLAPHIDD